VTVSLVDTIRHLDVEEAAERVRLAQLLEYANNPAYWCKSVLGEHLWTKQVEIAESVRDNRYTAVHSCHDSGKSYVASRLICWWLATHDVGDAFVVSTAPSYGQVRGILWREIRAAHQKGQLRGKCNQVDYWIDGALVGFGRKPDDCDTSSFQGIHSRNVLVVIDEASGVNKPLWDAADSLITNLGSRLIAIGNPDDSSSHFATVCKPGSGWNVIHIDGLETPNFTGEAVPDDIRDLLLSPVWVEERKARWGESSAIYLNKVRGMFAEHDDDGVVPLSWIRRCQQNPEAAGEPVQLGVDIGLGGDLTVIYERRGRKAGRVWTDRSKDPMTVAGKVLVAIRESGADRVVFDEIGVGWAPYCRVKELAAEGAHNAEVIGVNVGAPSTDKSRFCRLRDEIWWIARELSETGSWDLSGVSDDVVADLIAPRYRIDSAGRVAVERKDETRARLGRSPDHADALLLAFFVPQQPSRPVFLGSVNYTRPASPRINPNIGWE
jgi:hypothetical protein